jgi:hypothetical protein
MKSDMLTVFQRPAIYIFLCAFQTVTRADIPVRFWIVTFKNNMCNGEIVGINHGHSFPFRKQDVQILGNFHAVIQCHIDEDIFFSENEDVTMGIILCGFYHVKKIFIGGDISRNMEAEKAGSSKRVVYLFPVGRGIVSENFQIAIVGFLYILIDSAQLGSIALLGTGAVICTGDDGRQGNGFDFTHFPIALADGNFNSSHNVSPICCCCVGVSYLQ